ncbi:MAG TPA: ABC transporter ATP-binding protein, partial [Planctomycetota bacterium]|nr:ABC transporter ATP-binding protein [Planctomycetota bacterium]
MTDAIALRSVQKAYRGRAALAGLDLRVAPGTIHGFVGPNGAGKSTALRILVGIVQRDAGEVRVLGLDPAAHALAIRRRTSYLPGETAVYGHLTGAEFLRFAFSFYPRRDETLRAELEEAFALPLVRKVRTYSAGMKQKLALLATLVPEVDLYVLDEPDRALDASTRVFLRAVLRRLQARGSTLLLSSHHLAEVEALTATTTFVIAGRTVPPDRVAAARSALRRVVRLRLRTPEVALPAGVVEQTREPDGTMRVTVAGDALAWLR